MNVRQDWKSRTLLLKPPRKEGKSIQTIVYNVKEGRKESSELETLEDEWSTEDSSSTTEVMSSVNDSESEKSSLLEAMGVVLTRPTTQDGGSIKETLSDEKIEDMLSTDLSKEERKEFEVMLQKHSSLFILDYKQIKGVTMVEHQINLNLDVELEISVVVYDENVEIEVGLDNGAVDGSTVGHQRVAAAEPDVPAGSAKVGARADELAVVVAHLDVEVERRHHAVVVDGKTDRQQGGLDQALAGAGSSKVTLPSEKHTAVSILTEQYQATPIPGTSHHESQRLTPDVPPCTQVTLESDASGCQSQSDQLEDDKKYVINLLEVEYGTGWSHKWLLKEMCKLMAHRQNNTCFALAIFWRTTANLLCFLDSNDILKAYTLLKSVLETSRAIFSSCFEKESTCGCVFVPIQSWSLACLVRGVPCPLGGL
ncbi:hypothetical protein L7F22_017153 [Adiantum nelumboides]|nr:hypothetical protein [Adiantum nelumboides]